MLEVSGAFLRIVHSNGSIENVMYVKPTRHILKLYEDYFHEAGHLIGDILSFVCGDTLTPEEIEDTIVPMSTNGALSFLTRALIGQQFGRKLVIEGEVKSYADRVLDTYTKGAWHHQGVTLRTKMDPEIRAALTNTGTCLSATISDALHILPSSSRIGRNHEVSSIVTQIDCMRLLVLSLQARGIVIHPSVLDYYGTGTSHERAFAVIEYLRERGKRVPSMKDLDNAASSARLRL